MSKATWACSSVLSCLSSSSTPRFCLRGEGGDGRDPSSLSHIVSCLAGERQVAGFEWVDPG